VNSLAAKRRNRRKRGAVNFPTSIFRFCDQIRETSFALRNHLRHGQVEKVHENGSSSRLRKQGVPVIQQHPLNIYGEDGTLHGEFFADLVVAHRLVVGLKACRTLAGAHVAPLLGHVCAFRVEHGLLVNFGAPKSQIRNYVLSEA
jgi:GxxExxY protein